MGIGLESLGIYTSRYFIDLKHLAAEHGIDPDKYYLGLGQEKMAIAPVCEDAVTLGANAAFMALEKIDGTDAIDTLLFATESGVDQSKAGGIYIQRLLGLSNNCRVIELKQACYSSTGALQLAAALVAQRPERKVLVVASDIARYGLGTPGEPTQGCGAVAMLVSSRPRLLSLEPFSGLYTEDIMDFWRPNYRAEALVDGKFSTRMYISVLEETFRRYLEQSRRDYSDIDHFCYHLPFTRIAEKAHARLARRFDEKRLSPDQSSDEIAHSLVYNRIIGNSYTASLYIGLCSLLENTPDDLGGQRVGFYSYGSGCVGEYFSGVVTPGYRQYLRTTEHSRSLSERSELSYRQYADMYGENLPEDGGVFETPRHRVGRYRLAAIDSHKRIYEAAE